MHFKKFATLTFFVLLTLFSWNSNAQFVNTTKVFLKDSSSVRIFDDTTAILCSGQQIWLYHESCTPGDIVRWSNGASGDSIAVSNNASFYAFCQSLPNQRSQNYYFYFDNHPQKPTISKSNLVIQNSCLTEPTFFLYATCEGYSPNAIWQDDSLGIQYFNNKNGTYSAKCINQCGISDSSTVFQVIDAINNKPKVSVSSLLFCEIDSIKLKVDFSLLKNDSLDINYYDILWSNGDINDSTYISESGDYYFTLTSKSCNLKLYSDTVTISIGVAPPLINISNVNAYAVNNDSINICGIESVMLAAQQCTEGTITWNTSQTGDSIMVTQPGIYYATCTKTCGTSQPSRIITVHNSNNCQISPPVFSASANYVCNTIDKVLLTATCTNSTLKWKNPADSVKATVSVPVGYYSAVCTVRGIESLSSFVNITLSTNSQTPEISSNKTIICRGEDATLVATGCFSTNTIWSNGLTGAVIVVKTAGTYTASCSNACGPNLNSNTIIIRSDEQFPSYISISGLPNCYPDSATLTAVNCSSSSVVWSNGATTPIIKVGPGAYSATCQNICGFIVNLAEVIISSNQNSLPPIISVDRNIICGQEKAKLFLNGCQGRNIIWSSGQIGNEIFVGAGTYSARCTNGCDTSGVSNIISVMEVMYPAAPSIFADTLIVCGTEKTVLTTNGCVNGSLVWSTGATSNTISVGIGIYSASCQNLCGRSPNSNLISIQSGPRPAAPVISASKGLVCGIEKSTLSSTGCTNGTISWSAGLGTGNTKLVGAGTYTTICTNSCGQSSQSNAVTISAGVFPSAPIITSNKNVICDGDSATLTASGCSGIISWSNGMIPFQIKIAVPGTYTARCTNSCGTSTNSSPIIINKFIQPEIPILTADNANITDGDTATISVANCNGTVRWNNSLLGTIIKVTEPGVYSANCSNICGTSATSETIEIFVDTSNNRPIIKANKLLLLPNELATLSFENCISNVLWSNGMTTNSIEVGVGIYSVSCETSFGYFSSDSISIFENCRIICIPIKVRKNRF